MPVKPRHSGDRGAVTVMFALLVAGLLAVGVIVTDVGALYVEGRQLQNGAENAAVAIAATCVPPAACTSSTAGDGVANLNAGDGQTQVERVCGTAPLPAPATGSCPVRPVPDPRKRFGCRPPSGTAPYVEVNTRSLRSDGTHVVPSILMRALDPTYAGAGVRACARAAYGSPSGLTGELPMAISVCEANYWRDKFGLVGPADYSAAKEATLFMHANGDKGPSNCPARNTSNNMDTPGGFGWLPTTTTCSIATTISGDAEVDPGNDTPKGCSDGAFGSMWKQLVNIPIYSAIYKDPVTGKVMYDIIDYSAFYLTGYKLGGNSAYERTSPYSGIVPCSGGDRCISGFFSTEKVPATAELVPSSGYGTTAIKVVG